MVLLNLLIRVCSLWTYSAQGTKVHLYWFMRNWWQSWPSELCGCTHMCARATCSIHTYAACAVSSAYLLCLLPLPLSFFFPSLSFLPLPHTYLSLSFTTLPLTHTSPLYRIVVCIDSWPSDSQYPKGHFVQTNSLI